MVMIMRQQFRDGLIRPRGHELSTTAAANKPFEYGQKVRAFVASLCESRGRATCFSEAKTDGPRISLGW